jgi:adenylate cyclase
MQLAMATVNAQNRDESLPAVEMRVGVNTGEVVVGNIGSPKRAKYGLVGSHVNLTARIESYTVGGQILISEATRQAVANRVIISFPPVGNEADRVAGCDVRSVV